MLVERGVATRRESHGQIMERYNGPVARATATNLTKTEGISQVQQRYMDKQYAISTGAVIHHHRHIMAAGLHGHRHAVRAGLTGLVLRRLMMHGHRHIHTAIRHTRRFRLPDTCMLQRSRDHRGNEQHQDRKNPQTGRERTSRCGSSN